MACSTRAQQYLQTCSNPRVVLAHIHSADTAAVPLTTKFGACNKEHEGVSNVCEPLTVNHVCKSQRVHTPALQLSWRHSRERRRSSMHTILLSTLPPQRGGTSRLPAVQDATQNKFIKGCRVHAIVVLQYGSSDNRCLSNRL
jgi:hypothetical protein